MTVKIDTDAVINNVVFTDQGSNPATPSAGKTRLFTKSDGLYIIDDDGDAIGPYITGTITVAARYTSNAAQNFSSNTGTIVNFEDAVYDTHSAVTIGAAWKFTAPISGHYLVCFGILTAISSNWAASEFVEMDMYKNNVNYSFLGRHVSESATAGMRKSLVGSDTIYLASGEFIDLRFTQNSGSDLALHNDGIFNHISINKVT